MVDLGEAGEEGGEWEGRRAYFEYEGCDLENIHFFGVVPPVLRGGVWGCTSETVAHCLDGDEDDACEGHCIECASARCSFREARLGVNVLGR